MEFLDVVYSCFFLVYMVRCVVSSPGYVVETVSSAATASRTILYIHTYRKFWTAKTPSRFVYT